MATEVVMPKFGVSMETGVIAHWLVSVGDPVKKGDPVAEVDSEKLTNNATAHVDGIVAKLLLLEGEDAPCGTPIMIIAEPGEVVPDLPPSLREPPKPIPASFNPPAATAVNITPRAKKLAEEKGIDYTRIKGTGIGGAITIDDLRDAPVAAPAPQAAAPAGEVKLTPKAKKYAEEKGLAYEHITGTGLLGMITVEDLKLHGRPAAPAAAAPAPVSAPAPEAAPWEAPGEVIQMTQMQQAVCKGMMQSLQNTAQSTLCMDMDALELSRLYASLKGKYQQAGFKLSYTAMIVKAVAMTLEEHPGIRAQMVDATHYTVVPDIDVGVAVDVPGGLVVPVIRQASLKDLRTIAADLADISTRAREGKLRSEDLGGAAMTVTNLGMFGITYFTPILNPPESAILGVGTMEDRPMARDGGIHIRPMMYLSLTYDHRIINGAPAARFLKAVIDALSQFRWN